MSLRVVVNGALTGDDVGAEAPTVRLINEMRQVPIAGGGDVEGIVRVRGFDLSAHGRGIFVSRQEPVALLVRDAGAARRVAVAPAGDGRWLAACIAAPILARAMTRLWSSIRRT